MNLTLSEEQLLIKNSADKFFSEHFSFEQRRQALRFDNSIKEKLIGKSKELGWYALPFNEKYGGLKGNVTDVMTLIEVFGSSLNIDPYIFSVLFPGMIIENFCDEEKKLLLLSNIIEAKKKVVFCHAEPTSRYNFLDITCTSKEENNKYYLNGKKIFTIGANTADYLIVTAKGINNKIYIFLIDNKNENVFSHHYKAIDDTDASDIEFNDLELDPTNLLLKIDSEEFLSKIEFIYDYITLACCSDALGTVEKIYTLTLEYVKTREQFGKKIGSFQVIQHRIVEMYIKKEEMRSLNYMAQLSFLKNNSKASRIKNVSLNKIFLGTKAKEIGQDGIQLHGGMGVADEMQVGHYFKRLTLMCSLLGDVDYHYDRFELYDKV